MRCAGDLFRWWRARTATGDPAGGPTPAPKAPARHLGTARRRREAQLRPPDGQKPASTKCRARQVQPPCPRSGRSQHIDRQHQTNLADRAVLPEGPPPVGSRDQGPSAKMPGTAPTLPPMEV